MTHEASARGFSVAGFLVGVVIASLVVAVLFLWFRGPGRFDSSRPAVVRHIQQLQRLETVVFGMDKIVSGGWQSRYLPTFLAGEQLLLIVYGEVTAGVDLGRIGAEDISVSGRAMGIPPAGAGDLRDACGQRPHARLLAADRTFRARGSAPGVGGAEGGRAADPAVGARRRRPACRGGQRAHDDDDVLGGLGFENVQVR